LAAEVGYYRESPKGESDQVDHHKTVLSKRA